MKSNLLDPITIAKRFKFIKLFIDCSDIINWMQMDKIVNLSKIISNQLPKV